MLSYFRGLHRNIRFYVLLTNVLIASFVYAYLYLTIDDSSLRVIEITQTYGFLGLFNLYLALLAGPFVKVFPGLPINGKYIKARRAIGVSAFLFALMHARSGFFDELGGFASFFSLGQTYIVAILLSTTALFVLSLMAATSFDYMVKVLTFRKWKMLHGLVYIAGIFILIHATLIGGHMSNPKELLTQLVWLEVILLVLLHVILLERRLRKPIIASYLIIIALALFYLFQKGSIAIGNPFAGDELSEHGLHLLGAFIIILFFLYGLVQTRRNKIK